MKPDFIIRPATPDDISFIYATWLKSFKHDSSLGKSLRSSVFFENYRIVIDHILGKPETTTLIACHLDEPNVIYGYMVKEPQIIHYMFVKDSFRRLGIATYLFKYAFTNFVTNPIEYTHLTFTADPILRNQPDLIYNPLRLYQTI